MAIDARADQKILFLFCLFWFLGKRKRKIFWGWRSVPLTALATIPVTLLLCLVFLEMIQPGICIFQETVRFYWNSLVVEIHKNKTGAKVADVLFLLAFEPTARVATGARLWVPKDEDGDWLLLATRGWRGFCFFHGYLLKSKYLAMLTKTMTAPKPVATCRRANMCSNWALCFVERRGTIHKEQRVLPWAKTARKQKAWQPCPVGQPKGRYSLFYTLENIYVIKCAVTGWRDYCLTIFVNTIFPTGWEGGD